MHKTVTGHAGVFWWTKIQAVLERAEYEFEKQFIWCGNNSRQGRGTPAFGHTEKKLNRQVRLIYTVLLFLQQQRPTMFPSKAQGAPLPATQSPSQSVFLSSLSQKHILTPPRAPKITGFLGHAHSCAHICPCSALCFPSSTSFLPDRHLPPSTPYGSGIWWDSFSYPGRLLY